MAPISGINLLSYCCEQATVNQIAVIISCFEDILLCVLHLSSVYIDEYCNTPILFAEILFLSIEKSKL